MASTPPLAAFPVQRTPSEIVQYSVIFSIPLAFIVALLIMQNTEAVWWQYAILALSIVTLPINLFAWLKAKHEVYTDYVMARNGQRGTRYHFDKIDALRLEDAPASTASGQATQLVILEVPGRGGKPFPIRMRAKDPQGLLAAIRKAAPQLPVAP